MIKVTVLIAIVCILLAQAVCAEENAACVEILTISGQAEVSRKAQDFASAEEGMILEAGDRIRTKESSSVEISFDPDDKNVSKIGENSSVVLLLNNNDKLELMEGSIFSTLSDLPKGSSFEIKTPSAVAGVRGTDWSVEATSDTTIVESLDNNAFVKNINPDGSLSSEETVVPPGFAVDVKKFNKPQAVRRMPNERLHKMNIMKADVVNRAVEVRKFRKPPARMLRQKRPIGPDGSSGSDGPGGPRESGGPGGSGDMKGCLDSDRPGDSGGLDRADISGNMNRSGDRNMGPQGSCNIPESMPGESLRKDGPKNNNARAPSQNIREPQRNMARPVGGPVGPKPAQRSNPPARIRQNSKK